MVTNRYFAHDSADGRHFDDRITAVGYLGGVNRWWLGENLAWGTYNLASPAAIMNGWMNSPGHRENILGEFSEVGIAIVTADPNGDTAPGGTYVTDFGRVQAATVTRGGHRPRRGVPKNSPKGPSVPVARELPPRAGALRARLGCANGGLLACESRRPRGWTSRG
jgi:hypothetical protein